MPAAEYKQCLRCGVTFYRRPKFSQKQWDKQRFHSLGCASSWKATTHGAAGHLDKAPEYQSWIAMKSRCLNPNATHYDDYGGRGITICDQWKYDFPAFLAGMGARPPGTSLDRIDPNGGYAPGNCRWATPSEQANNRRDNGRLCEQDGCDRPHMAKGQHTCVIKVGTMREHGKQVLEERRQALNDPVYRVAHLFKHPEQASSLSGPLLIERYVEGEARLHLYVNALGRDGWDGPSEQYCAMLERSDEPLRPWDDDVALDDLAGVLDASDRTSGDMRSLVLVVVRQQSKNTKRARVRIVPTDVRLFVLHDGPRVNRKPAGHVVAALGAPVSPETLRAGEHRESAPLRVRRGLGRDGPDESIKGGVQMVKDFTDPNRPYGVWRSVDAAEPTDLAGRFKGGCITLDGRREGVAVEEASDFIVKELQLLVDAP